MEKKDFFKNVLELSAEELTEASKIKERVCKILEKDFFINCVSVGFEHFEISTYSLSEEFVFSIDKNRNTRVKTSVGYVQVPNEVGEILLTAVQEMYQKNKYINIKLLPL